MATVLNSTTNASNVRIRRMAFALPEPIIDLETLDLSEEDRARLPRLGQSFSHRSGTDSTSLMIEAARDAVTGLDEPAGEVGMIISAPSLISAYGLDIPAVAIHAGLGMEGAECLNLSQGCVGALRAMELAATYLKARPDLGSVLVTVGCMASTLTQNLTHGGFFWGDGAAAILLTTDPGPGLYIAGYAESAAADNWDAMKIRFGDGRPIDRCAAPEDFNIVVEFPDARTQADYVAAEQRHFDKVIEALMAEHGLQDDQIDALILPSFGRNRIELLLHNHKSLKDRIPTDFRYGHMGGVDNFLFLDRYIAETDVNDGGWIIAMTPSFTSLWGGVLFRMKGPVN